MMGARRVQNLATVLAAVFVVWGARPAAAAEHTPDSKSLRQKLEKLVSAAGGQTGVAVLHVESGTSVAVNGDAALPLFSVFKLPLAVTILKEVDAGRIGLEQKVTVGRDEVSSGISANVRRWSSAPVEKSVRELLELSIVESDNTASDKLLQMAGGPATVTARMEALGFGGIRIVKSTREWQPDSANQNRAPAFEIVRLLAAIQVAGEHAPLSERSRAILLGLMEKTATGKQRLRGALPPGTRVMDKTGTGPSGSATNDVGLIELPNGRGHLAVAVFISGSRLPEEKQEQVIAQIGLSAYHAFVTP